MENQQINKFKWSLFGVSLLLGAMLTIQINSGKNQNYNFRADIITINSSFAYEAKHRQQLLENIDEMQKKISSYQNDSGNQENVLEKMKDDLDKAKIEAGLIPIKGDGIRIEIKENPSFAAIVPDRAYSHPEQYHIWDWELLYLINILHSNGAQALSFNGQRIVTTSGIREVGVSDPDGVVYPGVMQVNLTPIKMPYVIEAIGDIDRMKGAFSTYIGKDYFVLKGMDMNITEFKGDKKLTLPSYTGNLKFQFAKEDKEGVSKP